MGPQFPTPGILPLAEPRLRQLLDFKIFVDTAPDVRLMRRIRREVEELLTLA